MDRYRRPKNLLFAIGLRLGLGLALTAGIATEAAAGPRDDMQASLDTAKTQFNDFEFDAALVTLEAAIARAQGLDLAADPALAPLLVLRGGIIYSNTGDRSRTVAAFQEAVRADYYIFLPIELRSEELQGLLNEARASVPQPKTGAIAHQPPEAAADIDVNFEALSAVPVEEGVTMVLYWRKAGSDAEFAAVYMQTFGNLGVVSVAAADHGGSNLEYFFYVYDGQQQALANYGDKTKPLVLELGAAGSVAPPDDGGGDKKPDDKKPDDGGDDPPPEGSAHPWPRVFFNLGVGTGFGVARGTAELTYQQFTPGTFGAPYGAAEQACAIERWYQGELPVAGTQAEFAQHLATLNPSMLPGGDANTLAAAYNPDQCGQRHPVTTGFATAPFHIAPELAVRVLDRDIGTRRTLAIVLGGFARLQVVTGSKVFTDDPNLSRDVSFNQQVLAPNPPGFQRKPDFTWAAGVKAKAMIGKRGGKFQGMVGVFGGYGNSRLRVNMGFSNDRNGNSVPDRAETALSGPADANNRVPVDQCTPVWPYNNGCMDNDAGSFDQQLALSVQASSPANEQRIDTVKLGPGFAGLLVGGHYQIHKNFGIYGEADIGGWFPDAGTLLIDINVGPVITF